jgi:hypothetical protein
MCDGIVADKEASHTLVAISDWMLSRASSRALYRCSIANRVWVMEKVE